MHDKARRPGRESRRPAGRDRSAWRSGRLRRSAGTQSYHSRSAVGHGFLAGHLPCPGDRAGKAQGVQQIAAAARLEIVYNPAPLPIDVRPDTMRCLRLPGLESHPDVLVRGADPDEREAVEQPDPDVMTNPDIRTRQLVREVLRPALEVLRAHGGGDRRPARDRGGHLPRDAEDGPLLCGEPTGGAKRAVDLDSRTQHQHVEWVAQHGPRAVFRSGDEGGQLRHLGQLAMGRHGVALVLTRENERLGEPDTADLTPEDAHRGAPAYEREPAEPADRARV